MNQAWSNRKFLLSTSYMWPNPFPISHPASSFIKSNDKPHTWTHKGRVGKVAEFAVIPLSHRLRTKSSLSKLQGPLSKTQVNWLSSSNRNWNSPSPTSTILKSFPSFHTDHNSVFTALCLYGLLVRNLPNSVSENSSILFSLWAKFIFTTSPYSFVSCIFCSLSSKSKSIPCFLGVPQCLSPVERKTHLEWERRAPT